VNRLESCSATTSNVPGFGRMLWTATHDAIHGAERLVGVNDVVWLKLWRGAPFLVTRSAAHGSTRK
jgi:hypothetical protein